jgi:DNA-binding LacI/PurR family transcriptional regulator
MVLRKEPRGNGAAVTMADVAARAGVSTSTASLAFRTTGPITEKTRARILAIAAEMGYSGPNPMAQSLKRGRSGIVGVVVAEQIRHAFHSPVTIATMDGLSEVLDTLGTGQLLLPGGVDSDGRSSHLLDTMPLDAVVFLTRGEDFDRLIPRLVARRIPMVGIEGPHHPGVTLVEIDDARGMLELAQYVASLGHSRVGVVMRTTRLGESVAPGPVEPVNHNLEHIGNSTIRERLRSVHSIFPDAVRVEAGGRDVEAGDEAATVLLSRVIRPTILMAQNDLLAAGALRAAARLGIRVPEDLSVTGFDGVALPWLTTRLTTVEQPLQQRGREAGRMIGEILAGGTPDPVRLAVTLRPGDTTAPL